MNNTSWLRMPLACIGTVSNSALVLLCLLLNMDDGSHNVPVRQQALSSIMKLSPRRICQLTAELTEAGYIIGREQKRHDIRVLLREEILPPKQSRNARPGGGAQSGGTYAGGRNPQPESGLVSQAYAAYPELAGYAQESRETGRAKGR